MGLLTTITFRNDAYHSFEKHGKELIKGILGALSGNQKGNDVDYFSIGDESNPVIIQKTVHSDDTVLYLCSGNTVVSINELKESNEWALEVSISAMEYQLKRLKLIKSIKTK